MMILTRLEVNKGRPLIIIANFFLFFFSPPQNRNNNNNKTHGNKVNNKPPAKEYVYKEIRLLLLLLTNNLFDLSYSLPHASHHWFYITSQRVRCTRKTDERLKWIGGVNRSHNKHSPHTHRNSIGFRFHDVNWLNRKREHPHAREDR